VCLRLVQPLQKTGLPITHGEHTPYKSFIGQTDYKGEDQHNWTAHRQRGYKVRPLGCHTRRIPYTKDGSMT
jgi:hypothetical protein